jgi:hypothetical protein
MSWIPHIPRGIKLGSTSARTTAILYSLIETAKLNGVDPAAYLLEAAEAALAKPGAVTLL